MPTISKGFTGGMNSDVAYERIDNNDYLSAINLRPYSVDGKSMGKLVNIKGNVLINNVNLPSGTNKVIKSYTYEPLGRIYYFVYNSNNNHQLWEYDSINDLFTLLIQDMTAQTGNQQILGLRLDKRITHVNMLVGSEKELLNGIDEPIHNYLFWVYDEPHYINVFTIKSEAPLIDKEFVSAIKYQPVAQIRAEYNWDLATTKNALWGRAWRFRYRYVYRNGERSAWSPISKTPVPTFQYPSSTLEYGIDNVMYVNFKLGDGRLVNSVELAVSYTIEETNQWSSWYKFESVDNEGISPEWRTVKFYGYEALTPILDREADLLFDDVPLKAETQELLNGNTLVYGNITRDFDLPDHDCEITNGYYDYNLDFQGGLAYEILSQDESTETITYRVYVRHGSDFLADISTRFLPYTIETGDLSQTNPTPLNYYNQYTYNPTAGDTVADVVNGLASSIGGTPQTTNAPFYLTVTLTNEIITRVASGLVRLSPDNRLLEGVAKTWDNYYRGKLGIAYRDAAGRLTSVIDCGPVDTTDDTFLPVTTGATARTFLHINHLPPDYARSFQIVRTNNSFNSDYLEWVVSVTAIDTSDAGTATLNFTRTTFDTKFPSNVIDFIPQKGDGIIFISNIVAPGEELPVGDSPTYVIGSYDPGTETILVQGLDSRLGVGEEWFVRIYRETPQNETYYEFGEGYEIIDAGLPTRRHFGNISSQPSNQSKPAIIDLRGDTWKGGRMYFDPTGIFSASGPLQSTNMSDYFSSQINDNSRPNTIDDSFRERNLPATLIHGEPINTESDINNISRIYPENSRDYDIRYGDIKKVAVRGSYLICYQELNTQAIPIEISIVEDLITQPQYAISRDILNKGRYYNGEYGIGDKPSSFTRIGDNFYHYDPNKGCWVRLALDGMNPISVQSNMGSFFNNLTDLYKNTGDNVIGGFDYRNKEALLHFEEIGASEPLTISFNEYQNRVSTIYSYHPDEFVNIDNSLFTFKDGQLWVHEKSPTYNNFYGVQYDSEIDFVFNDDQRSVKEFLSLMLNTNVVWEVPDIETSLGQLSSLVADDFVVEDLGPVQITNKEGIYSTNFLRDLNSPGGLLEGDFLKGVWIRIKMVSTNSNDNIYLFASRSLVKNSPYGVITG